MFVLESDRLLSVVTLGLESVIPLLSACATFIDVFFYFCKVKQRLYLSFHMWDVGQGHSVRTSITMSSASQQVCVTENGLIIWNTRSIN